MTQPGSWRPIEDLSDFALRSALHVDRETPVAFRVSDGVADDLVRVECVAPALRAAVSQAWQAKLLSVRPLRWRPEPNPTGDSLLLTFEAA